MCVYVCIYIYIYIYVCVCVCVCGEREGDRDRDAQPGLESRGQRKSCRPGILRIKYRSLSHTSPIFTLPSPLLSHHVMFVKPVTYMRHRGQPPDIMQPRLIDPTLTSAWSWSRFECATYTALNLVSGLYNMLAKFTWPIRTSVQYTQ